MRLQDCKIGTRVKIYATVISAGKSTISFSPTVDTYTIDATLLQLDSRGNALLGFAIQLVVDAKPLAQQWFPVLNGGQIKNWWMAGYHFATLLNAKCECILPNDNATATQPSLPSSPKEAPCRQCSRTNDFGCKQCWLCDVSDPTDYAKIGP